MKAIICTAYGPPEVLQLQDIPQPVPADDGVLVRVHATSVNYGDLLARNFRSVTPRQFNMPLLFWLLAKLYFGLRRPRVKILGSEFSGVVEAVGTAVRTFQPGDEVFGYLGQEMGAYAEYLSLPEGACLTAKPDNLRHEEAAVLPYGAVMALGLLRRVDLRPGRRVLINGASGAIGSAAVQLAKHHFGAEVTGVCGGPRMAYVSALGADRVIDYTKDDFTRTGQRYDLIFDVLGKSSFAACRGALTEHGIYLRASFKLRELLQMLRGGRDGGPRVICAIAPGSAEDLVTVKELIEAGKLEAIIDRRFPLADAAAAHRYVESGERRGSVVIAVRDEGTAEGGQATVADGSVMEGY